MCNQPKSTYEKQKMSLLSLSVCNNGSIIFAEWLKKIKNFVTVAQSICTHYSSLSGRPDIFLGSGTLKKPGLKYGVQKAGCKKQGHCYSKREEAAALFSF